MESALGALTRSPSPLISIVVPVLNEEGCVEELARRVRSAVRDADYELLFVDDGSVDGTQARIAHLRGEDERVKTIRFTRSFGQQAALAAGLQYASGDAVITMDGDLQHPPECIPLLLEKWRAGANVVHAERSSSAPRRKTWPERLGRLFYPLMKAISSSPVLPAHGDFRLLDRRAVDAFDGLGERSVFIRGLIPWLGFREDRIEYTLADRFAGDRKYSPAKMTRLALDGIFSFSVLPLRVISLLGLATTLFGVAYGVFSVVAYFLGRTADNGWASIVVLILIFGGVQLLSLGIVSEYVGRIYEETKRRPRYVIDSFNGVDAK